MKLNLGCGSDLRAGYVNCDWKPKDPQVRNVNLCWFPWPFSDGYADEIMMIQVLEHLPDTLNTFSEIRRILKPGGVLVGAVPFCFSETAFIEPDHCRYFHPQSFHRLAEIYGFKVDRCELVANDANLLYKLRNMIPLRSWLKHAFNNMYDEIHFKLRKV